MDQKLSTFLTLCETMNYRKTAEKLHLTQPAVTRQIQSLEQSFGVKLFHYDGRRLFRTEACKVLEEYAVSMRCRHQELLSALSKTKKVKLRVGATKTIGDYVIAPLVEKYLLNPEHELSLTVDNTQRLLELLYDNKLDFALVEGFFDRNRFNSRLFRSEEFLGVCAKSHPFAGRKISLEELFAQTLLVREPGSGTRNVFEEELAGQGYTLSAFSRVISVSSFALIKHLLLKEVGVTFAYRAVAQEDRAFDFFTIHDAPSMHEFNFVYLKDTNAHSYVDKFCQDEEFD